MNLTYAFIVGWILLALSTAAAISLVATRGLRSLAPFCVSAGFGIYGLMIQLFMFSKRSEYLVWEVQSVGGGHQPVPQDNGASYWLPLLNGNDDALWPGLCLFFALLGVVLLIVKFVRYVVRLAKFRAEHRDVLNDSELVSI